MAIERQDSVLPLGIAGAVLLGYGAYRWRTKGLDARAKAAGLAGLAALGGAGYCACVEAPLPDDLSEKLAVLTKERIARLAKGNGRPLCFELMDAAVKCDLNMKLACRGWRGDVAELLRAVGWNSNTSESALDDFQNQAILDLHKGNYDSVLRRLQSTWELPDGLDPDEFGFTDDVNKRLDDYRNIVFDNAKKKQRNFTEKEQSVLHITADACAEWLVDNGHQGETHKYYRSVRYSDIKIGSINANPVRYGQRLMWTKCLARPQLNAKAYVLNLDRPLSEILLDLTSNELKRLHPAETARLKKMIEEAAVAHDLDLTQVGVPPAGWCSVLINVHGHLAMMEYDVAEKYGLQFLELAKNGKVDEAQQLLKQFEGLRWPPDCQGRHPGTAAAVLSKLVPEGHAKLVSDLGYAKTLAKHYKKLYHKCVINEVTGVALGDDWAHKVALAGSRGSKRDFTEDEKTYLEITPEWLAKTAQDGFGGQYPTEPFLIGGIDIGPHLGKK